MYAKANHSGPLTLLAMKKILYEMPPSLSGTSAASYGRYFHQHSVVEYRFDCETPQIKYKGSFCPIGSWELFFDF